ncbi:MAG: FtsX-like permease family protein [Candidatus Thorarchaeota archaeon]
MFRYALKRVARSYRLFIALTIGVLLATTFFASTNVAADILSRDALDASVEGIFYDFAVDSRRSNWTLDDVMDLETDLLGLDGVTESTHSSVVTFNYNSTGLNMTLAGIELDSELSSGMQLVSGRSILGPNETYIVSGSTNESLFMLDQIVEVNISVARPFLSPYIIQRNLTVAGLIHLPEETRDAIEPNPLGGIFGLIAGMGGGAGGAMGFFTDVSYNLMITDWSMVFESVLEEAATISPHAAVDLRNIVHLQIERARYLDPYDISASVTRIQELGDIIGAYSTQYEGTIISNLEFPLIFYQFTQIAMSAQFLSLSLPIFLLSYFVGTMVSDVGYNFRRREIGLLLTKGYQRSTIRRMFLVEGVLVGGLAGTASVFIGTWAAYYVLGVTDVNIITGVLNNSISVILSIILGMFLGLFSVWRPAGRASKLEIIDALKQYVHVEETSEYKRLLPMISFALGSYKLLVWILGVDMTALLGSINFGNLVLAIAMIAWLAVDGVLNSIGPLLFLYGATRIFMRGSLRFQEAVVNAGKRFFGAFGTLATRNVKRNPSRTATLVFIIALIVSYGIFATGSLYSQNDSIERTARYDVGADVRLEMNPGANVTQLLSDLASYPAVIAATPEYRLDLSAGSISIETRGVRPDEWLDIGFWEEQWAVGDFQDMISNLGGDEIILSRDVAQLLELDVGNSIFVEGPFGSGSFELTVVGLIGYQSTVEIIFGNFAFATGGEYISFVSEDFLNSSMLLLTSTANILIDTALSANGTLLQEQLATDLGDVYSSYSVTSEIVDYQSSSLRSGTTKIQWLSITFAVILAMVGTGLVVILTLREKDPEIALLSVRGFSKWQLFKTLLAEVLVTIVFALLLGLFVGYVENLGQVSQLNEGLSGLIRYQITLGGAAGYTILLLLGVVLLAAIIPVWWASRRAETKVIVLRS